MTHVSLFSGIGGIDLAAEWAGFRTIAQVERDPYCQQVLEKHWPGVHRVSDIRDFPDERLWQILADTENQRHTGRTETQREGRKGEWGADFRGESCRQGQMDGISIATRPRPAVTLISGGFPCQPFSAAGKRRGTEDDRHLWPEMYRVIRALHPRWVLAENVPGILAIKQGMVFESVLADLEAEGYETWTGLIPAAGVGAPHLRYRIFVVAHHESGQVGITRQSRFNESMEYVAHTERNGSRPRGAECTGQQGRGASFGTSDVGHASGKRRQQKPCGAYGDESANERRAEIQADKSTGASQDVADTAGPGWRPERPTGEEVSKPGTEQRPTGCRGCDATDTEDWWAVEPDVGRVAHGVPHRVDRLRALGNAVVPQQVYPILKAIADTERSELCQTD